MLDKFSVTKVLFDSDVVISGSASRQGAAFVLLQLSELGLIKGFISPKVVDECRKNLQIKLSDALPTFQQIISHALTVTTNPSEKEISEYSKMAHQKDLPILTAALRIKAQFLVTFNTKDFYPDPEFGLIVLQPGDLLKMIRLRLSQLANE